MHWYLPNLLIRPLDRHFDTTGSFDNCHILNLDKLLELKNFYNFWGEISFYGQFSNQILLENFHFLNFILIYACKHFIKQVIIKKLETLVLGHLTMYSLSGDMVNQSRQNIVNNHQIPERHEDVYVDNVNNVRYCQCTPGFFALTV